MANRLRAIAVALVVAFSGWVAVSPPAAFADPTFPKLTGRVVDDANILSPATEASLTGKLEVLENQTHRQVVVATVPSLQGYEIEDYGYQLGRAWGIGGKDANDGVIFLVAPKEHKVRIEVGYGLEPYLTDGLSGQILRREVLPRFKSGDMEAGVVAGTDAVIQQLALPDDQAQANVAKAAQVSKKQAKHRSGGGGLFSILPGIIFFIIIMSIIRGQNRRRYGRGGLGGALPWIIASAALNSGRRSSWGGGDWGGGGGGGWGGGGGGFSGGGGSFGGGGASGSW